MRRLIFCFDGSWNKLDTKTHPTNVVLIAESIVPTDRAGVDQIVYYDEGVGTSADDWLRGGALGKGLVQNIREAYRFLIFNYQPNDEIFVFGFSRGAFTARSFIGFIRCAGVLTVNDAQQIDDAWKLYSANAIRPDDDPVELLEFRAKYCTGLCISEAERHWRKENGHPDAQLLRVRYCGVWDTVGSLGWKVVRGVFDRSTDKTYRQHDTELSDTVEAGRHAKSIDERRVLFMPTMWRNVRDLNERAGADHYAADAPFQQKWFAGDHGSVGGGGPERGLSNAALHWVLRGAVMQGLAVRLEGRSQLRDIRYHAGAALHNTPSEGLQARKLGIGLVVMGAGWIKNKLLTKDRSGPDEITDIHNSVLRRWFLPPESLEERALYRPRPLSRLASMIEEKRATYVPVETKAASAAYIVQPGDTLWRIARDELGDPDLAKDIFVANLRLIDDPNDIFPNDVLRLPEAPLNPGSAAASAAPAPG